MQNTSALSLEDARVAYPPLDTPKAIADDVWIVDGPPIRFGMPGVPWPKMRFPTRMTLIRMPDGGLFVHSPTAMSAPLRARVEALGEPRWLIAPNRIHYWWLPDWRRAYPQAAVYAAPRVREQAGPRIDFEPLPLDRDSGYPWDGHIDTLTIAGRYMAEAVFFHRASRTLLLTDFIENFEPRKLGFFARLLAGLGGALDPHGGMPRDMRMSYPREALGVAVKRMLDWQPQRIVMAHGRPYLRDACAELRRAFRWLPDIE